MKKTAGPYSHSYTINYSDIDNKLLLKPSHIVKYLQDIAIRHSTVVGYDLNWFKEKQQGWVILYWHIKISELPKEADEVVISTWTAPHRRIQANRDFLLKSSNGKELCRGTSRWVLIDKNKRKPARFSEDFFAAYSVADAPPCSCEDFQMEKSTGLKPFYTHEYTVTRRDTDTNGHANNSVYVDWAIDFIPEEIYQEKTIKDLKAAYKSEAICGDCVVAFYYKKDDKIIVIFSKKKDPTVMLSQIDMVWE